jgi:PEP-CTERM motif
MAMQGFWIAARAASAAALLLTALNGGAARAADINSPIIVPLQAVPYQLQEANANGYKYGIMASFGGSTTPQLFEFDTGASGIYAAYSTNPSQGIVSTWWGANVTDQGSTFNQQYTSGNTYVGNVVSTSVALFGLNGGAPIFSTASAGYTVGQATQIQTSLGNWPGNAPPVDRYFYGDFGVGPGAGQQQIANLFAQLTYASNLAAGFTVSTGPYGATSGAFVKIGLAAADLTNPQTTWFTMQPGNGSFFPFSNLPTYDSAAMIGNLALNGQTTSDLQALRLVLDTGAPNTGLYYYSSTSDQSLVTLVNAYNTNPQAIALTATTIGQQAFSMLAYPIIENGTTTNLLLTHNTDSTLKVNTGATLFQTFAVTYDFTHGLVGLTPYDVPEPSSVMLVLLGLAGLSAARARRG